MFQVGFVKLDEFVWWDMERIQTDSGVFFRKLFLYVWFSFAAPEHQEVNGQIELTWKKLKTIAHPIRVQTRVSEKYIHLALMYTTYNIFTVIPIKHLVNHEGEPNKPDRVVTGTNLRY